MSLISGNLQHINEIERALEGRPTRHDPLVVNSWKRCVSEYRMDPSQRMRAHIVSPARLREHRERSERLIHIARNGLSELYRQVAGHDYVLLLADNKGVTVDFFGDPGFERELREAGLYLGAEWSESRAGTCGVGSCIVTGEAMTIHQSDHFDETHTPLSCTAAPIYDAKGHLSAVLDISLLRPPGPKISQNLALHLVRQSARHIELANLMHEQRRGWVLCFSRSPAFLDVDPEHAVALDSAGNLTGMTHSAGRELARLAGIPWHNAPDLIGAPVGRFFQTDTAQLTHLTRAREPEQRILLDADGSRWYARLQDPDWSSAGGVRMPRTITQKAPQQRSALDKLHHGDERMQALVRRATRIARSDLPVLIQGETGSGKECLARALHDASGRRGPFIAVNCAAIPESLIEGELFGHAPGAFTGAAAKGRAGLIESADGGTLFLDEIGDMPLQLQARLLRFLSEGEVLRVGATQVIRPDVRVVSASLHDLETRAGAGLFRTDLFHRLCGAELWLPPLRERRDLRALAVHLLQQHKPGLQFSDEALELILTYRWPGNIRELDTALRYAALLCEQALIIPEHLPERLLRKAATPLPGPQASTPRTPQSQADLQQALQQCNGNVSAAARLLGIDRSTIYRRLRRQQARH
ncbi:sigma-54-dependent Fis family transcriptional regulator [Granulosicoccaceae sp. 1_MG-2023]|nr:sigma-54-dependent Fis family transcriptional regulator [Granulosicoccaceae sp. 1_MG-2023]